ncbi:uncharacterized protein EV422DRAFT_599814 [Fimicolochytrium jonesii]|uniref:uncharacterized protein n=1 Tax=Fimicolochytrium jonesii TaxID=1396493 RepID=UPI0022FE6F2E|nr:uncharacterized protein EV422DRAFT_599814 [Fimicolochytrium jonesii]KAI8825598.1 hypothetical protein EV422DRAFT_599814 [Fimicolochytrium jonesii]
MVGRRRLKPTGAWEVAALSYSLPDDTYLRDSRNAISMGISPSDERIHLAFNMHDSELFYIGSQSDMTSVAGHSLSWGGHRFGIMINKLAGTPIESVVAYPQFLVSPTNYLQMFYRVGTVVPPESTPPQAKAAVGLDPSSHLAQHMRGRLIQRRTYFIQSGDLGRNWNTVKNNPVAKTGSTPSLAVDDLYVRADDVGINQAMMNSESMVVTSSKSSTLPFTLVSHVPSASLSCSTDWQNDRIAYGRNYLLRRVSGGFNKTLIDFPLNGWGTSHLVLDSKDNAYVIYNDLRVVRGSKASGWLTWTLLSDFGSELGYSSASYAIDKSRSQTENVVSLLFQMPTGVRVIDIVLNP